MDPHTLIDPALESRILAMIRDEIGEHTADANLEKIRQLEFEVRFLRRELDNALRDRTNPQQ